MPFSHKHLLLILFTFLIIGGSSEKCRAQQIDSVTIFFLDFDSENLDESLHYLIKKIPRSLETEIGKSPEFHTLARDTSKKSEKAFQYDFESLSFDTLILNKLRAKYNIDIIVFGKITESFDSLFIAIKSYNFKTYMFLDSFSFGTNIENIDELFIRRLAEHTTTISKNLFKAFRRSIDSRLSILLTSFSKIKSDFDYESLDDLIITKIIDTLNTSFQEYHLVCKSEKVTIESIGEAQDIGKKLKANLILWWNDCHIENKRFFFQPSIFVNDSLDLNIYQDTDQNLLSAAIGQLSHIELARQSNSNFQPLVNFLMGYIFLKKNNFKDAIKFLKKVENDLYGDYYLGDSYLRLGKSQSTDVALIKANLDTAIDHYRKCLALASGSKNQEMLVWVLNNLGVANQLQGDLPEACDYFEQAISKKKELKIDGSIVRIYNNLGNVYLFKGEWTNALKTYQNSISSMEELGDKKNLAITYDNMGDIYQLIMQSLNAIKYYENSLSLRQEMGDELGVATAYANLGDVYFDRKEYDRAFEFYNKELEINMRFHNEPRIARTYDKLGCVYQQKGAIDSALFYFQKSFELFELIGQQQGIITTSIHLAAVYYKQKDFDKAFNFYERSMFLAEERNDEPTLAQIYDNIANIYNARQSWDEALDFYEKSAKLYEKLGYTESHSLLLFNMGLIHLKKENYHTGYHLMKRAIDIDEKYGFFNLKGEKDFLRDIESIIGINKN